MQDRNQLKERAIQSVVEQVEREMAQINANFMPCVEVLRAKADVMVKGLQEIYKIESMHFGEGESCNKK